MPSCLLITSTQATETSPECGRLRAHWGLPLRMSTEPRDTRSQSQLAKPPVLGAKDLENNDHTSKAETMGRDKTTAHKQLDSRAQRVEHAASQRAWTELNAGYRLKQPRNQGE